MIQLLANALLVLTISHVGMVQAALTPLPVAVLPGYYSDSLFGSNLALAGDRLFVGAPQENNLAGAIRLFDIYSADLLLAIEGTTDESLGNTFSVSADGRFLAIITPGSVVVLSLIHI